MTTNKKMFFWNTDADYVCDIIRRKEENLRIVLKTKNDELLIERWIRHYLNMLGEKTQLIIMDNMSTSDVVAQVYEKYAANLLVIKFEENYNFVHKVAAFKELYKAIWDSSKYYAFLDTDEFLFLYDGEKLVSDGSIVSYLNNSTDVKFFSNYWLVNDYFRDDVFIFKDDASFILNKIMFGKPIINSSMMRKDINMFQNNIIIHAAQLPVAGYGKSPSCFVVLHMNAISKTHRIRSDMEKLTAVNIARHRNDFQTILHIDIDDIPSPVQQGYVKNVRALIAAQDVQATDNEDIEDGHIRVDAAGSLIFYPPNLKEVFNKYVSCELSWLDDIKKIDWGRAEGKICALWAFLDIESYQRHHAPPSVR